MIANVHLNSVCRRDGYFDFTIPASIMAIAFCGLNNDKYTKYSHHKNCVFRDNSLKGTSHRKE
jgi:hypothetical protein